MRSFPTLLFASLVFGQLLATSLDGAPPAGPASPPNLIFVLADDLGWGDLGAYGQKTLRTPILDRLASEGLRFTAFYAGSTVCAPSRCVLMTGLHTGHAFIRGNGKDNLRPEDVTVAEILANAGYTTGLFGKWGIGHEGSTGLPTRQGFDEFFGYLDQHHAHNYYPTFLVRNEERVALPNEVAKEGEYGQGVATKRGAYSHDLITDEALGFVERHRDDPFFLYWAMTLPHANNEAGKRGMEIPDRGAFEEEDWPDPEKGFAAMVARVDRDVGRLLAKLTELGIADRTIVFFTSDNGPHAEGGHDAAFFDSNGPFRGIKRDLTEGGIRVPLIVRWPGVIEPGRVTDHVASFQDVLPTLAEIAGRTGDVPAKCDGISFLPALRGDASAQKIHPFLYWAFYERGGAQAIRSGRFKVVEQPYGTPLRVYDIERDPGETTDIAEREPGVVAQARAWMAASYTPSERWKFPEPKATRSAKRGG